MTQVSSGLNQNALKQIRDDSFLTFQNNFQGSDIMKLMRLVESPTTKSPTYEGEGAVSSMTKDTKIDTVDSFNEFKYNVFSERYATGFNIDMDDIRISGLVNAVGEKATRLALKGAALSHVLFDKLVINAQSEICADGKPLVSTTHEFGDSGQQSNLIVSPIAGSDPTLNELKLQLQAAISRQRSFKDDKGELVRNFTMPISNFVICSENNARLFEELFGATEINFGDGNARSNIFAKKGNIYSSANLPDDKWWYSNGGDINKFAMMQETLPFVVTTKETDVNDTDVLSFRGRWTGAIAPDKWHGIIETTFTP